MRNKLLAIGSFVLLASLWHAGIAFADDPTPAPSPTCFPELDYVGVPTHTMTYTQSDDEVYNLIPIEHSEGLTLSLDLGFWTWDNFVMFFRIGNTVKSLGNQYHIYDILAAFVLTGLVIGPLVGYIRSRGGGGGGGGVEVKADSGYGGSGED